MENSNIPIAIEQGGANPERPFSSFRYPHQVLSAPNMDLGEKKAILAAWASDVNAVESLPTLRHLPGTPFAVTLSSIMDALAQLDRNENSDDDPKPPFAPGHRFLPPQMLPKAA